MKKITVAVLVLLCLISSAVFAERIPDYVDEIYVEEYDASGNMIHSAQSAYAYYIFPFGEKGMEPVSCEGQEVWNDYDRAGRLIHSKTQSYGEDLSESWYEYDSKGNCTYTKTDDIYSGGYESWADFDAKGNNTSLTTIYTEDGSMEMYVYEYDARGNLIHSKSIDGLEMWMVYDSHDKYISLKNNAGLDMQVEHEYNDYGEEVYVSVSYSGTVMSESWYGYDVDGNRVYENVNDTLEYWTEYDSDGRITYSINSDGEEFWYEYEFYRNGTIKSVTVYTEMY